MVTFSFGHPPQEVAFRETSISGLIFVLRLGQTGLSKIVLFMGGGYRPASLIVYDYYYNFLRFRFFFCSIDNKRESRDLREGREL